MSELWVREGQRRAPRVRSEVLRPALRRVSTCGSTIYGLHGRGRAPALAMIDGGSFEVLRRIDNVPPIEEFRFDTEGNGVAWRRDRGVIGPAPIWFFGPSGTLIEQQSPAPVQQ